MFPYKRLRGKLDIDLTSCFFLFQTFERTELEDQKIPIFTMPNSLISSVAQIILIGSLLQTSIADVVAPLSITILNTAVTNCDVPIFTSISANKTSLEILYDTSKSNGTTPDVLAWTDSTSATETVCTVCTTFKWPSGLYGLITSLDYGYYHRLDEGLLEQVASIITMNNGTSEVRLPLNSDPFVPSHFKPIPSHQTTTH